MAAYVWFKGDTCNTPPGQQSEQGFRNRHTHRYGPMFKYVVAPGVVVLAAAYAAYAFSNKTPPAPVQLVDAWYNSK